MTIELVTWGTVSPNGATPALTLKTPTAELDSLVREHIKRLRGRAKRGSTSPAEFVSRGHRDRFLTLRDGDEGSFLESMTSMATDLIARMDNRTDSGLICGFRRRTNNNRLRACVFKLDITDSFAGFLQESESGEETIAVIRNLLDTPSTLQKGAVLPDLRADSEVLVGDKALITAQYFLEALGIRQTERATSAPRPLMEVIATVVPSRRDEIAVLLTESESRSIQDFVESIPDLPRAQKEEIINISESKRRPLRAIEPDAARVLKRVYEGGGIRISGRVDDMNSRVRLVQRADGGWQVQVDLDEPPTVRFE